MQFPLYLLPGLRHVSVEKRRLHIQEGFRKQRGSVWKSIGGTGRSNEVRFFLHHEQTTELDTGTEGITAVNEPRNDGPRGLGDFQRRSNRDRDRGWSGRRDEQERRGMAWDATPQSVRDAPSIRVPNVGWDSTPRDTRGQDGSGWGAAKNKRWDAPTPRAGRDDSPEGEGGTGIDFREWEEEQVRLDRDWYTGAEDGGLVGDEEHNPLAQYEDLSMIKQAEIATKQTVGFFCHLFFLRYSPLL